VGSADENETIQTTSKINAIAELHGEDKL